MPIVLTQNDVILNGQYAYDDAEGVHYHYPNKYRNAVRTGERFVYYRGVNRKSGRRGLAEYFGCGRIGEVWVDPTTELVERAVSRQWYCNIDSYVPFAHAVPARDDGKQLEALGSRGPLTPGHFRGNSVRVISELVYDAILTRAGIDSHAPELGSQASQFPDFASVIPEIAADASTLFVPTHGRRVSESRPRYGTREREPQVIGERAEAIVERYLRSVHGDKNVRWVSKEGETPGWDIEVKTPERRRFYEVKGTSLYQFGSVEITANEWAAAREHHSAFVLALVTNCRSTHPTIALLENPWGASEKELLRVFPSAFRLSLS